MSASAKIIDLDAHRREPRPFGWVTLGILNSSPDKRDAARMYARLGLHPILLHGVSETGACTCGNCAMDANSRGKHPVYKSWQTNSLNSDAIDRDLAKNWRRNIGLRMGLQPNGQRLITIDVDGPLSLLAPLEAKFGPLPNTLTATSGKGAHLIFRLRADAHMPKNKVKLSEGVDVRSEGGQIVAAPSTHYSGRRYQWLDARAPAELP